MTTKANNGTFHNFWKTRTAALSSGSAMAGGGKQAGTARRPWKDIANIVEKSATIQFELTPARSSTSGSDESNDPPGRRMDTKVFSKWMYDVLKIPFANCVSLDESRNDLKILELKGDIKVEDFLGTFHDVEGFNIVVRSGGDKATKITFKDVDIETPNEELMELCDMWGEVEYIERHVNAITGLFDTTRFAYVKLDRGAVVNNYYWLPSPRQARGGRRIYVQCPGQDKQCSYCLESAIQCDSGAVGSTCRLDPNTVQMDLRSYMQQLRKNPQPSGKIYRGSLREQHEEEFPLPGTNQPKVNKVDVKEVIAQRDQVQERLDHVVQVVDNAIVCHTQAVAKAVPVKDLGVTAGAIENLLVGLKAAAIPVTVDTKENDAAEDKPDEQVTVDENAANDIVSGDLDPDDPVRKQQEILATKIIKKAKSTPHTARPRSRIPGGAGTSRKDSLSPILTTYRSRTPQVKRTAEQEPKSSSVLPPGKSSKTNTSPESTKSLLERILPNSK